MRCTHCGHTLREHENIDYCAACASEVAQREALRRICGTETGDAHADNAFHGRGLAEHVCCDFDH